MSVMSENMSDEDIFSRFNQKKSFQKATDKWKIDFKESFCRLVRAVHKAGFDWWHTDQNQGAQIRFGRKEPDAESAPPDGVLVTIQAGIPRICTQKNGHLKAAGFRVIPKWTSLDKPLMEELSAFFEARTEASTLQPPMDPPLEPRDNLLAYWPDQMIFPEKGVQKAKSKTAATNPKAAQASTTTTKHIGNRIYYGPPGTGKTYKLSELLKDYTDKASAFTPGEQRKLFIEKEITQRTWWEAVVAALHDLGGKAKVPQLATHPYIQAIASHKGSSKNINPILWSNLQLHAAAASKTVKHQARSEPLIFDKDADSTWVLLDGWKEQCPDLAELLESKEGKTTPNQRYAFVTFHQSYGYEEFVEGLRPMLNEEGAGGGDVQYEIRAGVFKQLCALARLNPGKRYAMVIDEINRGNISKIFGELITLIEKDKRAGEENAIAVTLPYSGDSFSVPANVDIIGTMNTADRSLALLDTALRRRFEFVPMLPDTRDKKVDDEENSAPLAGMQVQGIDVRLMLETMNRRIEVLYDRDHCIGHAYFTRLKETPTLDELGKIFKNKIIPLLEEYFFEDWEKIRLVLGDNQKKKESQFITSTKTDADKLKAIFGANHGLEADSLPPTYALNAAAFWLSSAYTGIYKAPEAAGSDVTPEPGA